MGSCAAGSASAQWAHTAAGLYQLKASTAAAGNVAHDNDEVPARTMHATQFIVPLFLGLLCDIIPRSRSRQMEHYALVMASSRLPHRAAVVAR